jgi:hypothetical protein
VPVQSHMPAAVQTPPFEQAGLHFAGKGTKGAPSRGAGSSRAWELWGELQAPSALACAVHSIKVLKTGRGARQLAISPSLTCAAGAERVEVPRSCTDCGLGGVGRVVGAGPFSDGGCLMGAGSAVLGGSQPIQGRPNKKGHTYTVTRRSILDLQYTVRGPRGRDNAQRDNANSQPLTTCV